MNVRRMKRLAAWPTLATVAMALALAGPLAASADEEKKEPPPVKMNTTADHGQF